VIGVDLVMVAESGENVRGNGTDDSASRPLADSIPKEDGTEIDGEGRVNNPEGSAARAGSMLLGGRAGKVGISLLMIVSAAKYQRIAMPPMQPPAVAKRMALLLARAQMKMATTASQRVSTPLAAPTFSEKGLAVPMMDSVFVEVLAPRRS